MKNKIKNYGLVINKVKDERAYVLGASPLSTLVLQADGQWDNYLPPPEIQHTPQFDSYGCTVYGTENVQQILEKRLFGVVNEYSERYQYNIAGINPPGHDPHDVAEVFRKHGSLSYSLLPMAETLEEYKTPRPVPKDLLNKGQEYPYELMHEWLWDGPINKTNRTILIKEYLKYSPLAVSVTAWWLDKGVYVDRGQRNTHWCVIYGWTDKGWKVYDSYAPHLKILSFDHKIEVCKRYQLVKKNPQIPLIWQIINKIQVLIGLLEREPIVPVLPEPTQPPAINTEIIYKTAVSLLGQKLYKHAPPDLACAESVCAVLNKAGINVPLEVSTIKLTELLDKDTRFKRTLEIKEGNIIISPTQGKKIGHAGIVGKGSRIMSNDSPKGIWKENYSLGAWVDSFRYGKGLKVLVWEVV